MYVLQNILERKGFKMKNKRILGFFVLLIFGLFMAGCENLLDSDGQLDDLVGVWEGSYGANQGETGLTLTVYEEGSNYKAIFDFYNLPDRTNAQAGKYYMNVSYNKSTKKFELKGYEWIEKPSTYVFVDFEGTISGSVFSGAVSSSSGGGTTFRVVRK
jgi:hypothetical protein